MDCCSAVKAKSGHFRHLFLILLILFLPACADSRGEARKKLEGLEVPFTGDAFIHQAGAGKLAEVQLFLTAGMDPNVRGKEGFTPLMVAAARDRGKIVELLLKKGADVNARDTQSGGTALIYAVSSGSASNVRVHVNKRRTRKVLTPGKDPIDIVRLLLDHGADLEVKDAQEGRTPLLWALRHNQQATVQALLDKRANLRVKDKRGFSALAVATVYAQPETLSLLLDRAGPREQDAGEKPLLIVAAAAKRTDNVRLLLDKGADVNARDQNGATALMWAAKAGKKETVQLLLERGADANVRDKEGVRALEAAKSNQEIMNLLLQAESKKNDPPQQ